jgi:calcineurin-like phosphoesterase family protein
MAIIVGDIHGNVEKVKLFLGYRPDEPHIALGDYLDSFHEPQERQLEALQLLLNSPAVLLWGNHDFNYHDTPPFYTAGYQFGLEGPYRELIMGNLSRFMAA